MNSTLSSAFTSSRLLVTTRIRSYAFTSRTVPYIPLTSLSNGRSLTRPSLHAAFPSINPCLPTHNSIGSVRFATSKAGGSTRNGRDSNPKYLGVKRYGGQAVQPGDIIVRQRGEKCGIVRSTATVAMGRDYTIYALKPGYVKFWWHGVKRKNFIEVVLTPPTPGSGRRSGRNRIADRPQKYPIVKLAGDWELPSLLSLPPDTAIDASLIDRLKAWIATLNPAEKAATVPRGVPLIGGIENSIWPTSSSSKILVNPENGQGTHDSIPPPPP